MQRLRVGAGPGKRRRLKYGEWVEVWSYGDRRGWYQVMRITSTTFVAGGDSFKHSNGHHIRNDLIRAYPCDPPKGASSHIVRDPGYRRGGRALAILEEVLQDIEVQLPAGRRGWFKGWLYRYRNLLEIEVGRLLMEREERRLRWSWERLEYDRDGRW